MNIAVYQYQFDLIDGGEITLADAMNATVVQNTNSFYVLDDGTGAATVLVDVQIGDITQQYTLTVQFADSFNFTSIRSLRTRDISVDHEAQTIEMTSDGKVSNVAIYQSQLAIIPGGTITLADAMDAAVTQNAGSFYIIDDGSGAATVVVDVAIGSAVKQYELTVHFTDRFDFDEIRTLRAADISVNHADRTIYITAQSGVENVALYMAQTNVINGGKLVMNDEMDANVQTNTGSYYIIKTDGDSASTVTADITIGNQTKTYEITVYFPSEQ